ncbi:MAG: DUF4013 domain-containing protein [Anaerolineae bacterium]|nr:DUF4013 domain-containing protein [Anaerolineae bacterium]
MDIGKALGFVFEDEKWIGKILLGILIALIPVFGQFALMGYVIAILRNVMAGHPRPLPEWNNLGGYFMDGLKFWVVTIVYSIPLLILLCPIIFIVVLPLLGDNGKEALTGLALVLSIGIGCLAMLYSILVTLMTPALQIRYAATGEIGQCLRIGEMFRFTFSNLGNIIIATLILVVLYSFVLPLVSAITLGLLAPPAIIWMTASYAHLLGQIGRQAGVTPYRQSSY